MCCLPTSLVTLMSSCMCGVCGVSGVWVMGGVWVVCECEYGV